VVIDHVHKIVHNKILIGGGEVITGSFNFTAAAENDNAENLLILCDQALAARYRQNWDDQAKICQAGSKTSDLAPAPGNSAVSSSSTIADTIVYITKTGKKHHAAGCSVLSQSCIPIKLSEAKAKGYPPKVAQSRHTGRPRHLGK